MVAMGDSLKDFRGGSLGASTARFRIAAPLRASQ
jgi:hypothetical protein